MVSTVSDDLEDDVRGKSQLRVGGKGVLQIKKSGAVNFSGNAIILEGVPH